MRYEPKGGFSLTELIVSMAVLTILIGLTLAAVQSARESARRIQCLNNLRNLGVSALALESATRHLPGGYMNAHPDSREYRSDTGLFVTMLPYLDCDSLFNAFKKDVPTNSSANQESLTKRPAILKCPSSGTSATLKNLSSRFSGEATLGLNSLSCDYVGNDGTYSNSKPVFGSVRLRVGKLVFERRLHEITDGSTQTLLFWESVGDFLRLPDLPPESMDEKCSSAFSFLTDSANKYKLTSFTQASTKSYVHAWTGFRIVPGLDLSGRVTPQNCQFG